MHRVAVLLARGIEDSLGVAVLEFDGDLGVGEDGKKLDEVLRIEADIDRFTRILRGECFDRFSLIGRGCMKLYLSWLHGQSNRP